MYLIPFLLSTGNIGVRGGENAIRDEVFVVDNGGGGANVLFSQKPPLQNEGGGGDEV